MKNQTKRIALKIIIENSDSTLGTPVVELQNLLKKEIGGSAPRVFYQVVNRLKELGIAKIKWNYDLDTGKRYKAVVLTPDVFEWRVRNKIIKILKR